MEVIKDMQENHDAIVCAVCTSNPIDGSECDYSMNQIDALSGTQSCGGFQMTPECNRVLKETTGDGGHLW